MRWSKPARMSLAMLALAAAMSAPGAAALARPGPGRAAASLSPQLRSRQLWATINVCNPFDQPDMVGIRGSMPGDGVTRDTMYMKFSLQYLDHTTKRWGSLVDSPYVAVGNGGSARQDGRSFQLVPVPGKPAFTLRGVVSFKWRRGASVLQTASRTTTAGRPSTNGADPSGYSAATCLIG